MTTLSIRRFALLALAFALAGCGGRQVPPAQLGPDVLFQRGMDAFQARKYSRAIELLDIFLQQHVGDPRVPRARVSVARARMARRDYLLAAGDFTRLLNESPPDSLARAGRFGICEAYHQLSPPPQRDQQYTGAAIAHCESVASIYPGTSEAQQAAAWASALRHKLALKSYETGMFYFKRGAYDAGVIYFQETVEQFPGTSVAPQALLRMVESYDRIGYKEEAAEARARLQREYPESPEARSLQQAAPTPPG